MIRKIVTLCGSMRFADKMAEIAEKLELEKGYVVLPPIMHVIGKELTEAEVRLLGELHFAKIDISDAVFVVNIGGYIGDALKREMEYARLQGKEIIFLEETEI